MIKLGIIGTSTLLNLATASLPATPKDGIDTPATPIKCTGPLKSALPPNYNGPINSMTPTLNATSSIIVGASSLVGILGGALLGLRLVPSSNRRVEGATIGGITGALVFGFGSFAVVPKDYSTISFNTEIKQVLETNKTSTHAYDSVTAVDTFNQIVTIPECPLPLKALQFGVPLKEGDYINATFYMDRNSRIYSWTGKIYPL